MEWYYVENGERKGPVPDEELLRLARERVLTPDDLVWHAELGEQWQKASVVPGLFDAEPPETAEPPPPLPAQPPVAGARPDRLSCVDPVSRAWQRMVTLLFRPFARATWFGLGFTAWLATLGQGGGSGGGSGSYRAGGGGTGDWSALRDVSDGDLDSVVEQVQAFLREHGTLIALGVTGVVILLLVVGLVVLWLRSRGKFMFLDNLVNERALVSHPWEVFREHGNSLFKWTFVYSLLCSLVALALFALAIYGVAVPCFQARAFVPATIPVIILCGLAWLVFGLVAALIGRFLEDFVIPVMYRQDLTATEAWGQVMKLIRANFWRFVLYGLFYWLLSTGAGLAVMAVVLITCCTAACLLALPYLGAVVMLPVTVFFRYYSVEYLSQFGPDFTPEPEEIAELPPDAGAAAEGA